MLAADGMAGRLGAVGAGRDRPAAQARDGGLKEMRMRKFLLASAIVLVTAISASAQHLPQQGGEALYKGICQDCHMPMAAWVRAAIRR